MRRKLIFSFIFLGFCNGARAASAAPAFGKKPLGVLLVGAGGGSDWNSLLTDLRKSFGRDIPFEAFSGPIATKGLQRSLDRLTASKVEKILVIPLYLDSQSPEVEQLKYILGLRKYPSRGFLEAWGMASRVVPRAKTRLPLVVGGGLDDDPVAAEIIFERAREMSRKPSEESVVVIGQGTGVAEADEAAETNLSSLTMRVENKNAFKTVRGALIKPATKESPRGEDASFGALKTLIRKLSVTSRVILVPHVLTRDGTARAWRKKLDNLFFRWKGKALLPDRRMSDWVLAQIERFKGQADMVQFKDPGQALPSLEKKKIIQ